MKLLFKQRMFSWFDSYDIYDEEENTVYTVEGQLSWWHCLHILDRDGYHIGTVQQKVLTFMPKFELYEEEQLVGLLRKEFAFFRPHYFIDDFGWEIQGEFMEWDYTITGPEGEVAATISKELFHWTDTYVIDVARPEDALRALMVVLAIDAEKCSRK